MNMRNLFLLFLSLIAVVGACQMAGTADQPKDTNSQVLFNGRDLDEGGWIRYISIDEQRQVIPVVYYTIEPG